MNISLIRQELADALDTIEGLRVAAFAADRISVPAAVVGEVEVDFDKAMGNGLHEIDVKVRVYASRAEDKAGQAKLDGYLAASGASSIRAALEAARGEPGQLALNGAASDLRLVRVEGYGVYEVAGNNYYGAEFTVTVWASGS